MCGLPVFPAQQEWEAQRREEEEEMFCTTNQKAFNEKEEARAARLRWCLCFCFWNLCFVTVFVFHTFFFLVFLLLFALCLFVLVLGWQSSATLPFQSCSVGLVRGPHGGGCLSFTGRLSRARNHARNGGS